MEELKNAVKELLSRSYTTGNGGYTVDIGPALYSRLVELSGYDHEKDWKHNGNHEG